MPGDRTEQATPHHREKARKEGDILHSRELTSAAGTLAGVLVLGLAGSGWVLAAVASAAFVTAVAQAGGVNVHPGAASFKLELVNPLSNAKNLFSMRAAA